MAKKWFILLSIVLITSSCSQNNKVELGSDDPLLWLEEIEGEKSLKWIKKQNKQTLKNIASSTRYKKLKAEALKILESKDKIPKVYILGDYLYNVWKDDKNVRGLWRRTKIDDYKKKRPKWETVLDLDKLSKKENEKWVFKGAHCLSPENRRCLVKLSRGGKDAVEVREFDAVNKKFIKNGYFLKEAKVRLGWQDKDHIFVGTDFGKGSLTDSGYPRMLKLWTRGTKIESAKLIYEGRKESLGLFSEIFETPESKTIVVSEWLTFYTALYWIYEKGKMKPLPIQESAKVLGVFKKHFILELRKAWTVEGKIFSPGSLLALRQEVGDVKKVTLKDVSSLYVPSKTSSVLKVAILKDKILINALENVKGRVYSIQKMKKAFSKPKPMSLLKKSHLVLGATSSFRSDFFFYKQDFLQPEAFYHYNPVRKRVQKLKSLPEKFNRSGMVVEQRWVKSKDGTQVPYFLVGKKSVIKKGNAPTLLYGYGGFEVAISPKYKPVIGKLWLEKGGLYVLANIRGGGEFGPKWHQAALKMNRHKAYDDFIAVGEDLIAKKITSQKRLAIYGRSNGGLLVGAAMTRRPDLFQSVICQVPLLDMLRYSQLLAGASWMGEYGNPQEKKMRDYLLSYSPYQNVKKEKKYPQVLFLSSTKDDRVHPGHARKMALKMINQGHKNIHYFEDMDGGHKTTDLKQIARIRALSYEFLFKTLQ